MKNLYVVDGEDINDTTISDPKRQKGWLLEEITELIMPFEDEEYIYMLDDGKIGITLVDSEALAEWLINNGTNIYDENTNKYSYAIIKLLVEDIIFDFLADSIANITSYIDIPVGVQVSYYSGI